VNTCPQIHHIHVYMIIPPHFQSGKKDQEWEKRQLKKMESAASSAESSAESAGRRSRGKAETFTFSLALVFSLVGPPGFSPSASARGEPGPSTIDGLGVGPLSPEPSKISVSDLGKANRTGGKRKGPDVDPGVERLLKQGQELSGMIKEFSMSSSQSSKSDLFKTKVDLLQKRHDRNPSAQSLELLEKAETDYLRHIDSMTQRPDVSAEVLALQPESAADLEHAIAAETGDGESEESDISPL
jgi:hypothetical protein